MKNFHLKHGLKYFCLSSLYFGHTSKKWNSFSILFMLHDWHIRCSRGIFSYLPVSMNRLCDDVLNRVRASLYF